MTLMQELREAVSGRHPDVVCLGGVCCFPLDDRNLAKAEFVSGRGNYNGLRITILNRHTGPVDSLTVHFWELARSEKKLSSDNRDDAVWDICRPSPDISALWEMAEPYLSLFREPDSEMR